MSGELGPAGQCIPEEKSRRTVQETSKKQGAESCGTKAQRLPEGQRSFFLKPRSSLSATVHVSPITFCLQSRKKAEEKEGSFELEPQLCSSDCSSISTLLSKRQCVNNKVALKEKWRLRGQHSIWVHCSHWPPWSGESSWV